MMFEINVFYNFISRYTSRAHSKIETNFCTNAGIGHNKQISKIYHFQKTIFSRGFLSLSCRSISLLSEGYPIGNKTDGSKWPGKFRASRHFLVSNLQTQQVASSISAAANVMWSVAIATSISQ